MPSGGPTTSSIAFCDANKPHLSKHANTLMDKRLLDILVCPVTQTALIYKPAVQELWCRASRLAYPIRDGVPVMLEDEARPLTDDEAATL